MGAPVRPAWVALAFAVAAALASWNPLAAPFGVVVGLAALGLAVRALLAGSRRRVAVPALVLAALAVLAGATVLALTAGIGRDLEGTPVVAGPSRAELDRELERAADRTRAARERAARELEPGEAPAPDPGRR